MYKRQTSWCPSLIELTHFGERKCFFEKCIRKIFTNLAVLEITKNGFLLKEKAPGVSVEEIIHKTDGKIEVCNNLKDIEINV